LMVNCLSENSTQRPSTSEALGCDLFLIDTLPNEIEYQKKMNLLESETKLLEKKGNEVSEIRKTLHSERKRVEKELKQLDNEKNNFKNQTNQEKKKIEEKIEKLKRKEEKLEKFDKELQDQHKRQLRVVLPAYWKRRNFNDFNLRYYSIDVTKHMKTIIQEIMDATCNSATLGQGRDQVVPMKYTRLIVTNVSRIENASIFTAYNSRKLHLLSYKDPSNPLKVKTEDLNSNSDSHTWLKQSGLDVTCNEKYLWHGTKPQFSSIIGEHGFDERVSSLGGLFGAGVYFAEHCSKSDQYCTPDTNGEYSIFLCRVLLGRQIHHTPANMSQQRRPPEIPHANSRVYDSVVGKSNASNSAYREFIVYDRNQCYPEFLIKYKRQ
jgi:hypothetical protein